MSATPSARSYEGPFWFPFPPDDVDSQTAWTVDVVRAWSEFQDIQDPDALAAYRDGMTSLLATPPADDFPLRALLLAPSVPGFLVEFLVAEAASADWAVDHEALLASLEQGAIRKESAASDLPDVLSTISITVHREDPDAPVEEREDVFGQLLIAERRERDLLIVDLVGRVVSDDVDLLDLCIPPLLSFLHGDELIAAVEG